MVTTADCPLKKIHPPGLRCWGTAWRQEHRTGNQTKAANSIKGKTSYLICRPQCNTKTQGPGSKSIKNVKQGSAAWHQAWVHPQGGAPWAMSGASVASLNLETLQLSSQLRQRLRMERKKFSSLPVRTLSGHTGEREPGWHPLLGIHFQIKLLCHHVRVGQLMQAHSCWETSLS